MRELPRTFVQRLTALFRRQRLEDDLDEELRSHLEMAIELNLRKGMSAADARHEGRLQMEAASIHHHPAQGTSPHLQSLQS